MCDADEDLARETQGTFADRAGSEAAAMLRRFKPELIGFTGYTHQVYFCDDENFIDETFGWELAEGLARAGVRKRYFAWTRSRRTGRLSRLSTRAMGRVNNSRWGRNAPIGLGLGIVLA
ncbi:hypothetical protein [Thiorhodococcus fuscus]|uniref:Uncharacterized protein n=1 Tax=Thiorhodococcus fuscus TaxID=527200 RepID=A0ABW4Y4T3_9GAMM